MTLICDQQNIPYAEGRGNRIDNSFFIHAIVPRHVETVVLLWRKAEQADRHIVVNYETQGRHMKKNK